MWDQESCNDLFGGVLGYTRSAVFLTLYRVVLMPSYIGEGLAHEQRDLGVNVPVTEC